MTRNFDAIYMWTLLNNELTYEYIQKASISFQVMHSQSIRQPLTHPWIIAKRQGTIVNGNCDCKAGLGSTCTHAAAVLFTLCTSEGYRLCICQDQEGTSWRSHWQYFTATCQYFTASATAQTNEETCTNRRWEACFLIWPASAGIKGPMPACIRKVPGNAARIPSSPHTT